MCANVEPARGHREFGQLDFQPIKSGIDRAVDRHCPGRISDPPRVPAKRDIANP